LFALLLEQVRPLGQSNVVHNLVRAWVRWALRNFDTGYSQHGWLGWALAVLVPAATATLVHWALLQGVGWVAAALWNIAILYVTLGFRQFSHHFTKIRDALDGGDEVQARAELATWMHMDAAELPRSEILRKVLEYSVLSAHRHVFGVFAWYSMLAALGLGPAGAVLYRLGDYACLHASRPATALRLAVSDAVRGNATAAWEWIDWLPARMTALGFAFAGSFEEAVDGWRQHEAHFPGDNDGIVLAAAAGAVNVRLGVQGQIAGGEVPQQAHLRAVVGLVWRTVVTWMVFLGLLSMARLLG
jgi:adenosylcobinamide-phosphate synthase